MSFKHTKSSVFLDDAETFAQAKLDLELILNKEAPELIDEWSLVPKIWDRIRRKCDKTQQKENIF